MAAAKRYTLKDLDTSTPDYHEEVREVDGQTITVRICDVCGQERQHGDWPDCRKSGSHTPGTFGEEPIESYVDKNLAPEDITITTRAERRKIMAKNNLEYVPKATRVGAVKYFDMKR
jgi:hypothetical protein